MTFNSILWYVKGLNKKIADVKPQVSWPIY